MAYPATAQSSAKQTEEHTVPFRIVQNSGNRPNVKGAINGLPVTFDVHSNAGFYMQISHRAADEAKITDRVHVDSYGITSEGNVSNLGRDKAFVTTLDVGDAHFSKAPISIFETPTDYNHGMLGLRWLTENRVIISYSASVIYINPTHASSQARGKALLKSGYVALPMRRSDQDGRYYVSVTVNGVTQPMVVCTVAQNTFDIEFAKRAGLAFTSTGETYGGPTGTTGQLYAITHPATIQVGRVPLTVKSANVEDTYAYAAEKRPASPSAESGGVLAADFLIDNHAVVDFGGQILYVKPSR
ncbi:hypothetical protein GCM10028817_18870 [Spirosoma pomorum]